MRSVKNNIIALHCAALLLIPTCRRKDHEAAAPAAALPSGAVALHVLASRRLDDSGRLRSIVSEANSGKGMPSNGEFAWFAVADSFPSSESDDVIILMKEGRRQVLAHVDPGRSLDSRTGWSVVRVSLVEHEKAFGAELSFELDEQGGRQLSEFSKANIGAPLGIFVDSELCSHATIRDEISGSAFNIMGEPGGLRRLHTRLLELGKSPR